MPRVLRRGLFLVSLFAASTASADTVQITPQGSPEVGSDGIRVAAKISAPAEIFDAEIEWRYQGEKTVRFEVMQRQGDGTFTGVIPAKTDERGVEFRLFAVEKKNLDRGDWPGRNGMETIAAQPTTKSAARESSGLRAEVTVSAIPAGEKTPQILMGGEALSQGARVAFGIKTTQRAYVYLAERHTSGAFEVLFPRSGIATKNPIPANQYVRVPERIWFEVDNSDLGRETVMVLASTEPVANLEKAFDRAARGKAPDAAQGELLAVVTAQPGCRTRGLNLLGSDDCKPRTRGLILPSSDPGTGESKTTLRAEALQKDHMVYVPFVFEHVPRP